jgi:hypothetical protein
MTLKSEQVIENVRQIYIDYGKDKINTDKKLLLIYWRDYDNVEITKEGFSTGSWLERATDPIVIIKAKMLLECIYNK